MQDTCFACLVDHTMLYFLGDIFKTKLATNCKTLDTYFPPHGKHVLDRSWRHCSYEYSISAHKFQFHTQDYTTPPTKVVEISGP